MFFLIYSLWAYEQEPGLTYNWYKNKSCILRWLYGERCVIKERGEILLQSKYDCNLTQLWLS